MYLHEIKRMLDSLPPERLAEKAAMYHPFYGRCFDIEAVDDLKTIRPDLPNCVVFITAEKAHG